MAFLELSVEGNLAKEEAGGTCSAVTDPLRRSCLMEPGTAEEAQMLPEIPRERHQQPCSSALTGQTHMEARGNGRLGNAVSCKTAQQQEVRARV